MLGASIRCRRVRACWVVSALALGVLAGCGDDATSGVDQGGSGAGDTTEPGEVALQVQGRWAEACVLDAGDTQCISAGDDYMIRRFELLDDGSFSVSWAPEGEPADYRGTYTVDEETASLYLEAEEGAWTPPDAVFAGTVRAHLVGVGFDLLGARLGPGPAGWPDGLFADEWVHGGHSFVPTD